jgi:uncharacterized membrane protein
MSYDPEPSIAKYLQRLDDELRGLPRDRRREVVNEIAEHIAQAREDSPLTSEAELLNLLDRIGEPSEIAAEARERFDVSTNSNWHEIAAIVLLLVGGFVFIVGWLVGVVLLWTSRIWTLRDKLIGTLVVPGGLFVSAAVLLTAVGSGESCVTEQQLDAGGNLSGPVTTTCSGGHSASGSILRGIVFGAIVIAPIFTTIYLGRRLKTLAPAVAGSSQGSSRLSLNAVGWVVLAVLLALVAFVWLASQTLVPKSHS